MASTFYLWCLLLALLGIAQVSQARDVPINIQNFYNTLKKSGTCSNKLATGFWSKDSGASTFSYCGDYLAKYGIVYLQGTAGALANMDIDCDGAQGGPADDGRCGSSRDTQSITAFQYMVEGYGKGINDLNANVHPYVVFGNTGAKPGWEKFNPQEYGIQPLSLMAVVCGGQLIYGVWGDINGDDGAHPVVGEASISLATACYGKNVNGDRGHDNDDVLYLAFAGGAAVPGAAGANWAARNYDQFEQSIKGLGDTLISKIGADQPGGGSGGSPGGGSGGAGSCEWPGHCAGASCSTYDDCSDELVCTNRVCSRP
ncbi:family 75 glycoside hydrolase [Lasiosphaeris hirsuta]|uniref:Endo-chitosanase n=1 Tax=Lasiosphaeris hirsuta TaxID=260670 RepID=A0AA40AYE1_9PEZI|nr:family 75 glycoside hydrolase [Lasiosphaeris hirsuta]